VRGDRYAINFHSWGDPGHPDIPKHRVGASEMTDMAMTYHPELDEGREKLVTSQQTSTKTQTVITEQQVLLSTAAAVALPPARTHRWSDTVSAMTAAVGNWLASAVKPPKPVVPKRHVWLENALMSREMDRL
jgi:hypothetical protein